RECAPITRAEVEDAFGARRQQFDEYFERFDAMWKRLAFLEIRERVVRVDPQIRRHHGPISATSRTSPRSRRRTTLFTALRYARAEASTTSVATPRPVTLRPSASSVTVTAPSASDPPVTDETWKLRSV